MDLWASSETDSPAAAGTERARRLIVPYLNARLAESTLARLDCRLRYVPVVMPEGMHARYPARSRLRKKERIYDCGPILVYEVFVAGHLEDQLLEYIRGIALSAPHLGGIGASTEQIEEFKAILANAVERISAERPDPMRH